MGSGNRNLVIELFYQLIHMAYNLFNISRAPRAVPPEYINEHLKILGRHKASIAGQHNFIRSVCVLPVSGNDPFVVPAVARAGKPRASLYRGL